VASAAIRSSHDLADLRLLAKRCMRLSANTVPDPLRHRPHAFRGVMLTAGASRGPPGMASGRGVTFGPVLELLRASHRRAFLDYRSTRIAHFGPGAFASFWSAVHSSQFRISASAT
jgi:hypothetical protein